MHNKLLAFLCSLALASGLSGICTIAAADFNGAWSGSWSSSQSVATGGLQVTITQTGSSITGRLSVFNATPCGLPIQNVALTGTVTGPAAVIFDAQTNDPCSGELNRLSFTNGILSGNTITGNYLVEYDDFGWVYWDDGTYRLDRICCTINASAGSGGSITPSGAVTLTPGASQTFGFAANSGYTLTDVAVDGISQGAIPSYNFTNVQADHTISATFTQTASGALPFLDLLLKKK